MPSDQQQTPSRRKEPTLKEQDINGGGNRAYFIYHLRKMGAHELVEAVVKREISAMHAAVLCGIAARRQYARKGQRIVDEAEWQRLQNRVRVGEDGWPQKTR